MVAAYRLHHCLEDCLPEDRKAVLLLHQGSWGGSYSDRLQIVPRGDWGRWKVGEKTRSGAECVAIGEMEDLEAVKKQMVEERRKMRLIEKMMKS